MADVNQVISRLWGVEFKVRPTPEHPKYYEWQFGILLAAIWAVDSRSAAEKVGKIILELPYEVIDPMARVFEASKVPKECDVAVNQAKQVGMGLWLGARSTGSEESELETLPW